MPNAKSKKNIAFEILKKRIITNSLKPGEPLSGNILSKELKTSKTPVREALQQLERDGLAENIPGRGCFVSRISFLDIKELFEIRDILECEVIKRAIMKSDPEKIKRVRREFESLESNGSRNPKTQFKAGDRIHFFLFENFGNSRLNEIYRRLQEHVDRMRIYFFNKAHEERVEQSYREHLEILDALSARDPERAENAVRNHLRNSLEFLKKVI